MPKNGEPKGFKEAVNEKKAEILLDGVVFTPRTNKDGKIIKYTSSASDRKLIELEAGSKIVPGPNIGYQVEVVQDTAPDKPTEGKYLVRIVPKSSEVDWPKVEKIVNDADQLQIVSRKSKATLRSFDSKKLSGGLVAEEVSKVEIADKVIEELFREFGAKELLGLRKKNLVAALRKRKQLERTMGELFSQEAGILAEAGKGLSFTALKVLEKIRAKIQVIEANLLGAYHDNPEAYYGLHLLDLKTFKDQLDRGRLVETDYVKKTEQDILAHLRANLPVLIYGHLGSGKTEIALHVAKKFSGQPALLVSGSKNISQAEFYGHQVLAIDKIDKTEMKQFIKEVEEEYDSWTANHRQATDLEKKLAHDRILQTFLASRKGGTISEFFLGPIYQAMEQGRIVIIDEVNAIPHEVLISLNHILTRRVGETINVQQDSGRIIKIKEGFGILMTGNLGSGEDKYVDRREMDPAFLSRLHKIEYDYLPQTTEGSLEVSQLSHLPKELFLLLIAKTMDRNGNIAAPGNTFEKLWRLAQAARLIQNLFSGKDTAGSGLKSAGERRLTLFLKKSVLSIRNLERILNRWISDGYRYELDYYLWTEFVADCNVPWERAFIYQQLHERFDFFSTAGWPSPVTSTAGLAAFSLTPPMNAPGADLVNWTPRPVIDQVYGQGPIRRDWPGEI